MENKTEIKSINEAEKIKCKANSIMIKGKCRPVEKIPEVKVLLYSCKGEYEKKNQAMINHPSYTVALQTARYVGEYMKKKLKKFDFEPSHIDLGEILDEGEKRFEGEHIGSGGGFYHLLVPIDDNFNIVVDDQACILNFTEKKQKAYERFWDDWEKISQVQTHDFVKI